ncbi:hypothetical protein ISS30_05505 [bacterium]|nr:hypothetical protein [bacterium]
MFDLSTSASGSSVWKKAKPLIIAASRRPPGQGLNRKYTLDNYVLHSVPAHLSAFLKSLSIKTRATGLAGTTLSICECDYSPH